MTRSKMLRLLRDIYGTTSHIAIVIEVIPAVLSSCLVTTLLATSLRIAAFGATIDVRHICCFFGRYLAWAVNRLPSKLITTLVLQRQTHSHLPKTLEDENQFPYSNTIYPS